MLFLNPTCYHEEIALLPYLWCWWEVFRMAHGQYISLPPLTVTQSLGWCCRLRSPLSAPLQSPADWIRPAQKRDLNLGSCCSVQWDFAMLWSGHEGELVSVWQSSVLLRQQVGISTLPVATQQVQMNGQGKEKLGHTSSCCSLYSLNISVCKCAHVHELSRFEAGSW